MLARRQLWLSNQATPHLSLLLLLPGCQQLLQIFLRPLLGGNRCQDTGPSSPELCCCHISLAVFQWWTWGPEGPEPKWAVDTCKHTHLTEKKTSGEERATTCRPQTLLAGRKQAVVDQVSQSSRPLSWIWTWLKAEQSEIACFRSHFLSPAPGLSTQVLAS